MPGPETTLARVRVYKSAPTEVSPIQSHEHRRDLLGAPGGRARVPGSGNCFRLETSRGSAFA